MILPTVAVSTPEAEAVVSPSETLPIQLPISATGSASSSTLIWPVASISIVPTTSFAAETSIASCHRVRLGNAVVSIPRLSDVRVHGNVAMSATEYSLPASHSLSPSRLSRTRRILVASFV